MGTPDHIPPAPRRSGPLRRFWRMLGPGFITGASDDDPSGIGTYAQVGAAQGYGMLWAAPLTIPLMAAVQYMCAKVGIASGMGLARVLRCYYPRWVLAGAVSGLVVANTINAGVDIGAIAAAVNLLLPQLPTVALVVPIGLVILLVQMFGSFRLIEKLFKWLALSLLAYIGSSFFAHPDWGAVLRGTVLPAVRFDSAYLAALVAVLGTTISPYLFFWQADQEVEVEATTCEQRELGPRERAGKMRYARWDVVLGMVFSNVVMYFIILASAATLHQAGLTNIQTATDAALALRPLAGEAAYLLFALGLIGTGFLAVPVLTASAGYAVCEACGWPCSLDAKPGQARHFYAVIIASTLIGMLINFLGINPITALFWTAVINGFLAPPLLVLIMLIANNRQVMGTQVNGRSLNLLGWAATALMFAAAIALVLTWGLG